jgi:hypothetical protein
MNRRRRATLPRLPWARLGLGALVLGGLFVFVVYPTYPIYDSYYSLLWGRELLHGVTPSFDAYRAPTEHPLAVAFGFVLAILGDPADRVMLGACVASFVALAAGMYRLGRVAFTPLVGVIAAALVCTRFDFAFLAARGYIDIPYLAAVVWAAVLEAERPRRGLPVLALLTAAALMRPEAWLLIGLYWLWLAPTATWRQRLGYFVLTAAGPVIWVALDYAVTGKPLFSLQHTSGLADELGRASGLGSVPHATWAFLVQLDKLPVLLAAMAGLALALWFTPRRLVKPPLLLLVIGLGTFALVGLAGLSIINRYLLVPALMVMLFAGVGLGGWTMLRPDTGVRRAWAGVAVALVVFGVGFTALRVSLTTIQTELRFRGDAHVALDQILHDPRVQAGLRCGPLSTPNHKLVPDARWLLNAGEDRVLARSDRSTAPRRRYGVALVVTGREALFRQAFVQRGDTLDNLPPAGFDERVAVSEYYSAYVRCKNPA